MEKIDIDIANEKIREMVMNERKNFHSNIKCLRDELRKNKDWNILQFLESRVNSNKRFIDKNLLDNYFCEDMYNKNNKYKKCMK